MANVTGNSGKNFIHRLGDGRIAPPGYDDITDVTFGNDVINGLEGDDIIFGDAGNDQIIGGPAIDQMTGGQGDDLYYVDEAADQVFEEMLTPNAVGVAPVQGTFAINLTGNEFSQTIWGNAAANVLDGKIGKALRHHLPDFIYKLITPG
jgi:Ca2+-binding RTX toxin-like protein